ncbi:hypothetical protein BN874_2810005 [Candidatus Contendobacter odensis Run_B_J11]|uniref:Uncharacterized protein n=1 Tax=Candidatus Contendobacter odensis Run_B_J11 TaxID=1400861 RepID=A0A7U7GCM3_9GAMM|nr:hypothetical protein BN874_2810005 [Candidatus Contendobacter odensis Run_B_J11]
MSIKIQGMLHQCRRAEPLPPPAAKPPELKLGTHRTRRTHVKQSVHHRNALAGAGPHHLRRNARPRIHAG